jgi:peroxiredoxin
MTAKQSRMLDLGTPAPSFRLPNPATDETVALEDFASSPALLVAFLCNHCPYVKHILDGFVAFAHQYHERGLAVVAISSNDVSQYPADSPAEMAKLARDRGFRFPYLYDESQSVGERAAFVQPFAVRLYVPTVQLHEALGERQADPTAAQTK